MMKMKLSLRLISDLLMRPAASRLDSVGSTQWLLPSPGSWSCAYRPVLRLGLLSPVHNTLPELSLMCPMTMPLIDYYYCSLIDRCPPPTRWGVPIASVDPETYLGQFVSPCPQMRGACSPYENKTIPEPLVLNRVACPSAGACRNRHGWDLFILRMY